MSSIYPVISILRGIPERDMSCVRSSVSCCMAGFLKGSAFMKISRSLYSMKESLARSEAKEGVRENFCRTT